MIAYRGLVDKYGRIELAQLLLCWRRVLGPPSGHFERAVVVVWTQQLDVCLDPVLTTSVSLSTGMLVLVECSIVLL
jgi:hypothetical protein